MNEDRANYPCCNSDAVCTCFKTKRKDELPQFVKDILDRVPWIDRERLLELIAKTAAKVLDDALKKETP